MMPPRSSNFFKSRLFFIWLAIIGISLLVTLFNRHHLGQRLYSYFFEGEVAFTSMPIGTEVLFDGKKLGITPLTQQVSTGTHSVILQRGTWQLPQTVAVKAHEITLVSATFHYATVTFYSQPPGAEVLIDHLKIDTTPCVAAEVSPGSHALTYLMDGKSVNETFEVKEGESVTRRITLPFPGASGAKPTASTLEPATWSGVWRGWMDYDLSYGKKHKPHTEEALQVNADLHSGIMADSDGMTFFKIPMSIKASGTQLIAEGIRRNDPYANSIRIVLTRSKAEGKATVEITRRNYVLGSDQGDPVQSVGTMTQTR